MLGKTIQQNTITYIIATTLGIPSVIDFRHPNNNNQWLSSHAAASSVASIAKPYFPGGHVYGQGLFVTLMDKVRGRISAWWTLLITRTEFARIPIIFAISPSRARLYLYYLQMSVTSYVTGFARVIDRLATSWLPNAFASYLSSSLADKAEIPSLQ